jgi:hypothetical protein
VKALSVRSPWWWAILHGKPVENRDWHTNVRGCVLLHASKYWKPSEMEDDWDTILWMASKDGLTMPEVALAEMKSVGGCIVGSVEIIDCVREYPSAFFCGEFGFVLQNPIAFAKPIPFKGALGFFDVPDSFLNENAGRELVSK